MIHFLSEILIIIFFTAVLWFGIGWWVASIERAKTQRSRESDWNHRLNTLRRDRDAFRDEVEKSHGRIRVLENRRADGSSPPKQQLISDAERKKYESEITELKSRLDTASRKLMGLSQQVENLHQQSIERDDILEQLKKKLTDTSRTLHERERRLEQLNQQIADQAVEETSQQDNPQLSIKQYEKTIEDLTKQLQSQAQGRDTANSEKIEENEYSALTDTIERLRAELHQAQQPDPQIDHLQTMVKQLKEQLVTAHRQLGEQGHESSAQNDHLQQTIDNQQDTIRELREELNATKMELAEQSAQADPEVKHLQKLTEELQEDLVQSQKQLAEQSRVTKPQIESLQATVSRLQKELDSTRRELVDQAQQTDPQVDQMHNMVAHQQDLIARLQKQNESREEAQNYQLKALREAMAAQEQVVSGLRATLDKAIKSNGPNNTSAAAGEKQRAAAPQALMSNYENNPSVSGDLFGSDPATPPSMFNIDAINQSGKGPSITLFAQTPNQVDDLKKVNGIGPAFESVLNSIGIYQYKQLAQLSPADVIWVAETMRTFPDRLAKGRWVEQARALVERNKRS